MGISCTFVTVVSTKTNVNYTLIQGFVFGVTVILCMLLTWIPVVLLLLAVLSKMHTR